MRRLALWLIARARYANVVSTLALFVALGGVSYAAVTLPRASVGTRQLRNDAVTGAKVRRHSLPISVFIPGQLPRGAKGPAGPAGAAGPAGTAGANGATNVVERTAPISYLNCSSKPCNQAFPPSNCSACGNSFGDVVCRPGERATGGGFDLKSNTTVVFSHPDSDDPVTQQPNGWSASGDTSQTTDGQVGTVYVVCASP